MTDALLITLASLEDVSVSKEDDHLCVTCRGHDGESSIEIEDVHGEIESNGCRVRKTSCDFDAGEVEIEVIES